MSYEPADVMRSYLQISKWLSEKIYNFEKWRTVMESHISVIWTHVSLMELGEIPLNHTFVCIYNLSLFSNIIVLSTIPQTSHSYPRGRRERERGTMNEQHKEHTSFFKVLIKQSSVLLYVESPIILDLTCNVNSNFQFQRIASIMSCNHGVVTLNCQVIFTSC